MLLDRILENDTRSCYAAIKEDAELASLDTEFYALMNKLSKAEEFKLESIFSQYMARVTRISYLQGMKDFAELHIVLNGDMADILNR